MCTLLDLMLNQLNKIGVYIMRQIKKLTWLQACFIGDVKVIWCNSLGDSLFQIYVMNFVDFVFDFYSHITSHVSQAFASCTHYTYCVCFWFDQPSLKIPWVLCKTYLMFEILREWIENLNFGKTRFKTCVFEKHFISNSCMWFIKFYALRSFCIKLLCFSKISFFHIFDRLNLSLDQLKLW